MDDTTLALIRDYEGQIALLKLRIEYLEEAEAKATKEREEAYRLFTYKPEQLMEKMTVAGFPATEIRDIYRIIQEWHKEGGRPALLEQYRKRWAAENKSASA